MAIAFNSTSRLNEIATSESSFSWSHTCNALDTKLLVSVFARSVVNSVTYNGVAMTLIKSVGESNYNFNLYYLDNPATGSAYNIAVTLGASSGYHGGTATGLSGASSGIGASPNGQGITVGPATETMNITTTEDNSYIVNCLFYNTTDAATFGAGQTLIIDNTANYGHVRLDYKTTTSAGAYSSSITTASTYNIGIISVEIKLASLATNIIHLLSSTGVGR